MGNEEAEPMSPTLLMNIRSVIESGNITSEQLRQIEVSAHRRRVKLGPVRRTRGENPDARTPRLLRRLSEDDMNDMLRAVGSDQGLVKVGAGLTVNSNPVNPTGLPFTMHHGANMYVPGRAAVAKKVLDNDGTDLQVYRGSIYYGGKYYAKHDLRGTIVGLLFQAPSGFRQVGGKWLVTSGFLQKNVVSIDTFTGKQWRMPITAVLEALNKGDVL